MWIVRVALQRPYTFVVLALLILLASPVLILRTPTDIFPNIDIPVIAVAWQFTGLNPEEMEGRITTQYERILTTTVDNIEHIESTTVNGQSMVKLFLQPSARLDTANAQVTAVSQTILRQLPAGTQPPLIINYSASTVPILQLALSGLSESELNDVGLNFLRTQLVTVPGASIPYPYGGKQRQVMVDLDPRLLQSKGLAPIDVVNTLGQQNIVLPSGTAKIGEFEYDVAMNASPRTVPELNDLPIKVVGNSTIYIGDVAHVRDGFSPQTNVVRQDGQRGTLVTVLKTGAASTVDVVQGIRNLLPRVIPTLPPALKIQLLADQSVFVKAAVSGVIREAVIAACLTAVMILVFLGSWRSTVIIAVSIPLSILSSVIALSMLGETINIMTLGGLALAVGILVDDATVTIENIERHREGGHGDREAILDGAAEIAVPALVSTLCICIVFLPMFFLGGVARYLFVPLAEAVIFAMLASYVLSRTLVPTLAMYLLKPAHEGVPALGPALGRRLQQVHRERRHQGPGQHVGGEHREDDRFGQRHEEVAGHPTQEEHGQEHDADAEGGHQRGHRDLSRAVEDRLPVAVAALAMALDVLDGDGGVVHQDPHREGEAAQGHDIDRLAEHAERDHRAEDRERDGYRDDDGAAPAPQEDQDHHRGEAGRDHRLADHPAHRGLHEDRLVGEQLDLQRRGQGRDHPGQEVADPLHHVDGGRGAGLEDGDQGAAAPVLADDVRLGGEAVAHVGHVPDIDGRVADHLDREIVQLRDGPRARVRRDVVLELPDLGGAGRQHDVLLAEGVDDVDRGQALRLEQPRVQVDHHLALLAAVRIRDGRARHRHELSPQEVQADIVELGLRHPGEG